MIALVNPVSSGAELARAFHERGAACVHVYGPGVPVGPCPTGVRVISYTDVAVAARQLRALGVSAVVAASEFGVRPADELARLLELPGNDYALSAARRDKALMMERLRERGLRATRTAVVRTATELDQVLADFPFPLVVKPRDSAGSDGCRVCADPEQARAAFGQVIHERNLMGRTNDAVLVQEYLDGPQFIVNTVSVGGRHTLGELYAAHIDRQVGGAPVFRHMISARTLDGPDKELVGYVFDCLDALGVSEGAAHTEVRRTPDGPCLVEVNARVMGPCLAPDAYFAAFGYSHQHLVVESMLDPAAFALRDAAGYGPDRHVAKVFLRAHRDGVIRAAPGLDLLRRLPGFHSVARLAGIGDPVPDRLLTTGASGIAFFVHEDPATIENALRVLHELEDAGQFYELEPVSR
ncbi:ATP-grasp domain-containing protein [Actinoplanes sichuanensis]|uniref:ATP-grasp domain-containing protein n=1 Tax=Actinoplanes sichuanensis TaxID=512349 RepID=A0ABW4A456_9ACTN|nr:ATP-grasp domain-containing protein [Actinoplanes sichuanensis]BEL03194.1 ATP-grasp domain-containing protein [Actinoplanes sichuanensis]